MHITRKQFDPQEECPLGQIREVALGKRINLANGVFLKLKLITERGGVANAKMICKLIPCKPFVHLGLGVNDEIGPSIEFEEILDPTVVLPKGACIELSAIYNNPFYGRGPDWYQEILDQAASEVLAQGTKLYIDFTPGIGGEETVDFTLEFGGRRIAKYVPPTELEFIKVVD